MTNIEDPEEFARLWHDMDSHAPKTGKDKATFMLAGNINEEQHVCRVCGYMYVSDISGEIVIDCDCGRGR